ncbi:hypothetical protein [Halobellus salinisoli]|uniref:hypothetical protein n=1 Tax=Halobellus salinisoli TaxID=3108500 RepID=UPI00300A8EA1
MFRELIQRVRARFGDDQREESRFVPSLLDASVRHAHGDSGDAGSREIETVKSEAERLEEARQKR